MQCLLACRWYARGCCAFATLRALAPATTRACLVRQQRDSSASMRQRCAAAADRSASHPGSAGPGKANQLCSTAGKHRHHRLPLLRGDRLRCMITHTSLQHVVTHRSVCFEGNALAGGAAVQTRTGRVSPLVGCASGSAGGRGGTGGAGRGGCARACRGGRAGGRGGTGRWGGGRGRGHCCCRAANSAAGTCLLRARPQCC